MRLGVVWIDLVVDILDIQLRRTMKPKYAQTENDSKVAEAEAIAAERYRKWCGCCGCKAALREVEDD